ncbi:MAG TPA: hypothetical protein VGO31_01180 [Microbacteriaceae bacterium]|nr:hypothetical protein [Microbacteriaceae bacterium]
MLVPHLGVDLASLRLERLHRVDLPPLAGKVGEHLAAGIEQFEVAEPASSPDVRVERLGVALAGKVAGALAALTPAHLPRDLAARQQLPVDAHWVWRGGSGRRRLRNPFEAGAPRGADGNGDPKAGSMHPRSIHASTSAGLRRSREQSLTACNSPRSMAR